MYHSGDEEGTTFALPTPTDTPYRTPPRSRSPPFRHRSSISAEVPHSPLPLPPQEFSPKRGSDPAISCENEDPSSLNLRRFTPSLHASLVSEILSLRRDVETKKEGIEHLETSLHSSRNETGSLQASLTASSKEARSLKRQLHLLEGGTASAMNELTKERDDAFNQAKDLRQRQEQLQKKVRGHEEAVERTQMLWNHDRDTWESERRALETKVHIVEGRLKVVSSEIANSHLANGHSLHQYGSHNESPKKMHLSKGSLASLRSLGPVARRRDSEISSGTQDGDAHGYRLSILTLANGLPTSLADELALDEAAEVDPADHDLGADDSQFSADDLLEGRPTSVSSRPLDLKARKILGLSPEDPFPTLPQTRQEQRATNDLPPKDDTFHKARPSCSMNYVDTGTQCSPPIPRGGLSPADSPKPTDEDEKMIYFADALSHQEAETATGAASPVDMPSPADQPGKPMISTSSQTINDLPTPPRTPLDVQDLGRPELTTLQMSRLRMTTTATQTDIIDEAENTKAGKAHVGVGGGLPLSVPAIAIHPPHSRPATPTSNVTLPPHTKNASCQVDISLPVSYTSSSIQTQAPRDEAQATQLLRRLPSSKRSKQQTVERPSKKSALDQPARSLAPMSSRRKGPQLGATKLAMSTTRVKEGLAAISSPALTPGSQGPSLSNPFSGLARLPKSDGSAPRQEQRKNIDTSDSMQSRFDEEDIFNRPTEKFTLRAGKLVSKDKPLLDNPELFDRFDAGEDEFEVSSVEDLPSTKSTGISSQGGREDGVSGGQAIEQRPKTSRSISSRQADIRKIALISSGAAAHQASGDSNPPATDLAHAAKSPPFPVPTRHSSRKPPISVSEGAQSPTPGGRSPRKRDGKGRKPALRKVRSATNAARTEVPSPSPHEPPTISSSFLSDSQNAARPSVPLACGDATSPFVWAFASPAPRPRPMSPRPPSRADSGSNGPQQVSVVDAIAQTMVGEWMFKYVRRRKSFGVPEPRIQDWDMLRHGDEVSATITNTNIRHKRWVWLAPYERAVMWSSKQPTTGSALMGKSGRKLQIQSVLDVRDDTPLPRGAAAGPPFHRSILILTPERGLKFTAPSQERHHVWLNALSFLSHSPLALADLPAVPRIPGHECPAPSATAGSVRRNPIRDSIRVAKGRDVRSGLAGGGPAGGQRSFTTGGMMPQYPSPEIEEMQSQEPFSDAADPPTVPRYHTHGRRRSHTAPRAPPSSFRKFSFNNATTATATAPSPPPPSSVPPKAPSSIYSTATTNPPAVRPGSDLPTPTSIDHICSSGNNDNDSNVNHQNKNHHQHHQHHNNNNAGWPNLSKHQPHNHNPCHSRNNSRAFSQNHNHSAKSSLSLSQHHNYRRHRRASEASASASVSSSSSAVVTTATAANGGYFDPYNVMPAIRMDAFITEEV